MVEHLPVSEWEEVNQQSLTFSYLLNSLEIMKFQAKESIFIKLRGSIGGPSNSKVPLIIPVFKLGAGDKDMTSNTHLGFCGLNQTVQVQYLLSSLA